MSCVDSITDSLSVVPEARLEELWNKDIYTEREKEREYIYIRKSILWKWNNKLIILEALAINIFSQLR